MKARIVIGLMTLSSLAGCDNDATFSGKSRRHKESANAAPALDALSGEPAPATAPVPAVGAGEPTGGTDAAVNGASDAVLGDGDGGVVVGSEDGNTDGPVTGCVDANSANPDCAHVDGSAGSTNTDGANSDSAHANTDGTITDDTNTDGTIRDDANNDNDNTSNTAGDQSVATELALVTEIVPLFAADDARIEALAIHFNRVISSNEHSVQLARSQGDIAHPYLQFVTSSVVEGDHTILTISPPAEDGQFFPVSDYLLTVVAAETADLTSGLAFDGNADGVAGGNYTKLLALAPCRVPTRAVTVDDDRPVCTYAAASATTFVEAIDIHNPLTASVGEIEITFSQIVALDSDALIIRKLNVHGDDRVRQFSLSSATIDGKTLVTLNFTGPFPQFGLSLSDGRYRLSFDAAKIHPANGGSFDSTTGLATGFGFQDSHGDLVGDTTAAAALPPAR